MERPGPALMRWQAWMKGWIEKAGSASAIAFRIPIQPSTVGRWRDGQSFPSADLQLRLAEITGEELQTIRDLVWHAEKERAEVRRKVFGPLVSEVEPSRPFRRAQGITAGRPRSTPRTQPAGGGLPITRRSVKRARRVIGGVLILGGSLLGGAVVADATPRVSSQVMPSKLASDLRSSVNYRRRLSQAA